MTIVALTALVLPFPGGRANGAEPPDIGPALGGCPEGTPEPFPVRHDYCFRTNPYASVDVAPADVTDGTIITLTLSLTAAPCTGTVPEPVTPCVRTISWAGPIGSSVDYRLVTQDGTYFRTLEGTVIRSLTGPDHGDYYGPLQAVPTDTRSCVFGDPLPRAETMTCTVRLAHNVSQGAIPEAWIVFIPEVTIQLASSVEDHVIEAVARLHGPSITLTPSFSWQTNPANPLTIDFDASTSTADRGINRYEWDFDDGDTGTGQTTSHTFRRAGTYQVKLTIFDNDGRAAARIESVEVRSLALTVGAETPQSQGVLRGQRIRYVLDAQAAEQASALSMAGTVRTDLVTVDEASISAAGALSADGTTIDWSFANAAGTDPPLSFEVTVRTDAPSTTQFIPLDASARASLPSGDVTVSTVKLVTLLRERSITIVQETEPSGDPQDFSFTGSEPIGAFTLDTDSGSAEPIRRTFTGLDAGTYTVETAGVERWQLDDITCDDPTGGTTTNLEAGSVSIDLGEDEGVTCTFHSTKLVGIAATFASIDPAEFEVDRPVAIAVVVANTGGVAVDGIVPTLTLTGPSGPLATPQSGPLPTLPPGAELRLDYSFTPSEPGEYEIAFSALGTYNGLPVAAPPISSTHVATEFKRTVEVWIPGIATIPVDTATADHVASVDDMLVGDNLRLVGADFDPDGGPIEIRQLRRSGDGFDLVQTLPAGAAFQADVTVDFPVARPGGNSPCLTAVTATQDGVARGIEIHGRQGDLVAYAYNVKRVSGGFAESNTVECRGWAADMTEPLATLVVQDLGGQSHFYDFSVGFLTLPSPGANGYEGLWIVSPDFAVDVYGVFGDVELGLAEEDILIRGVPVESVQDQLPGGIIPPRIEIFGQVKLRPDGGTLTLAARLILISNVRPPELLQSDAAAGTTRLDVNSDGVNPGDRVRVNPGGPNQEDGTMSERGSIILASPLRFDHAAGEPVTLLGAGAPGACALEASTPAGVALDASARCPDDGDRRYSLVARPGHGEVSIAPDGTFHYIPAAGFAGEDVFLFESVHALSTALMTFGQSGPTTFRVHVGRPTLIEEAAAGSTQLDLSTNAGLVGKVVAIGAGETGERNYGAYVDATGSLILAKPLRFAHGPGEPVVALDDTLFVSVDRAVIARPDTGPAVATLFGTLRPVAGHTVACGENVAISLNGDVFVRLVLGAKFVRLSANRCVFIALTDRGLTRLELDLARGAWSALVIHRSLKLLTNPVEVGLTIDQEKGSEGLHFDTTRTLWTYAR